MKNYKIMVEVKKGEFNGDIENFNEFLSCPHIVAAETDEDAERIAIENIIAQNGNLEHSEDDPLFVFWDVEVVEEESNHKVPGFYETY